ncbi:aspartate--tRNA ligase [Candidatus Peregrinibacteria bacterium]|nr:aspartate--tRNA ligase [Candidatus Peregrinibacteria bacterium]
MYRTHTCNDLTEKNDGDEVILSGWVHRRRDHGGIIFIDLRDRYGLTQIVSDPVKFKKAHNTMNNARAEFVLKVKGKVRPRPGSNANKDLHTGEIEVLISEAEILNPSDTPPFEIDQDKDVGDDLRYSYRYLDLRRQRLKKNIILRHKVIKHIRDFLDNKNFLEIETPILIKGTPEGSREYLVPSRLYPGHFYVLPQSPQQLKQLLMIGGVDRYFQIARCFRDEDQRGDRQPEFTQLDLEMSFVEEEEVMKINEKLLIELCKKFLPDKKIQEEPFSVLTYYEAMDLYGTDSPDIRYGLQLSDITDIAKNCEFGVFKNAVENGGVVKALRVENGAKYTRREIDEFEEIARIYGAKGLAYIVIENGERKSAITKFFKSEELDLIIKKCKAKDGDIIFFSADKFKIACESLGHVRIAIANKSNLIDDNILAFCWVKNFPMFEYDEEEGRLEAVHHPFTAPVNSSHLEADPEAALAKAYDIVLNGVEIGGGSIRIHSEKVQKKVFDILKISEIEAERRFGHMLRAFKYGAPPHGGIAWGLDRLIMIFAGEPNIREVIAFPKDQKAKDLMLGAPSRMPEQQIEELHIKVIEKKKS